MTEVRCGCGTPAVIPAAGRSLIYWRERNKWKTHCGALFCSSWRELFRRFIHLSLGKSIHQPPIRRFSFPAALTLQPIKASSVELKKRRLIEFKWSVNRFFFLFLFFFFFQTLETKWFWLMEVRSWNTCTPLSRWIRRINGWKPSAHIRATVN